MIGRMRRARTAVILGLLVLAAYVGTGWLRRGSEQPRYVTAPVDRGPITSTVTATGTVNPVVSVQVGTYVSGPIQALYADYNTRVTRGQLLAKIDPRPFQVKVDGARADLSNARAQLEKSRADAALKAANLARARQLAQQGIVSQSDLDLAVSDAGQTRAQVTLDEARIVSAEAKLQEAQVSLDYTDIVSPVDGVVVSRSVAVGQTVAASFQTPTLFLVAGDLTRMEVIASVSESDIGTVSGGLEVSFTVDAYPGRTFNGRVDEVRNAPVTIQNVVTYEVVVTADNSDLSLRPGMTANVVVTTASKPAALRVATSALRFRPPADGRAGAGAAAAAEKGTGQRVWVLDGTGSPRPVAVTTGVQDERFTEIVTGLSDGDRVIVAEHREPSPTAPGSPFFPSPRRRGG
jgi:HlyD family secretion protein